MSDEGHLGRALAVLGVLLLTAVRPRACCVGCRSIIVMFDESSLDQHSCDDPTLLDVLAAERQRKGATLQ